MQANSLLRDKDRKQKKEKQFINHACSVLYHLRFGLNAAKSFGNKFFRAQQAATTNGGGLFNGQMKI